MTTATTTEVQNNFGKYLQMVQAGDEVIILKNGKEVGADAEKIREILDNLSLIFLIADLKGDDLRRAAKMNFKDYEDAVHSACASRIKADIL